MKKYRKNLTDSLTFKALTPLVLIICLLGLSLYFFVLSSVSGFVRQHIDENLKWMSHTIYNIINENFDELFKSGLGEDSSSLKIKKGLTIGEIEDYMRDNNIKGFIYSEEVDGLIFGGDQPYELYDLAERESSEHVVKSILFRNERYYAYHFHYDPWGWHIILLEDFAAHSGLERSVRRIYLATGSILFIAAIAIIFIFNSSIKRAIEGIITPIKRGELPEYNGIYEFEFLSDSFRQMMGSLRESEAKNRALIDANPDLMFSLNRDGTFTDYKPSKSVDLANLSGSSLGKTVFDVFPRDVADKFMQCLERTLHYGDMQAVEYQLPVGGIMRDYEARFVSSKEGEVLAIVRETTEHKRAIEGLVTAEEKFRTLVEQSLVGIYIIQDGKFPYVNPKLAEICGYTQEEMISSISVMDVVEDGDRALVSENLRKRLHGETLSMRYCFRIQRSDGELRDVEVQGARTVFNDKPAVIGTILDITERQKAMELLRYSEEKYRRLFMESKDVIYITTRDGKLADINPAGVELFGYSSREELMEVDIAQDLYVNPADRDRFQEIVEEQGFVKDYELVLRRRDGQEVIVLVTGNLVRGSDGEIIGYRGIMRNVTEQKALEGQFLQAQKMEAVGRLAGGIAHDINNYLGAVTGFCDIVRIKHSSDDEIVEKMDAAIASIVKASALIKQLLAFSRMQPVKPVVVKLNDVVGKMEKMMMRLIGEDIDLHTDLGAELWNVKVDPSQVEQVIVNLLVNSRDAMPQGGRVTIRTANVEVDDGFLKKYPRQKRGHYVLLSVSDTGIGIPPKIRDKIFEPFFTTKGRSKGSGLGLSTVYGIVKQNDGYVWVDSEMGSGATFQIYLPVCEEEVTYPYKEVKEPAADLGGHGRILIAEDNPDVRESLKAMLETMGYSVTVAANGEEAIALFDEMGGNIDLLVTDVVMPGMSGKEVADRIKKVKENVKVLFISGYDDNVFVDHNIVGDGFNLLQKPFPAKELARKIKGILV